MSLCPICNEGEIVETDILFHCSNQSSENQDGNWVETGTCKFKAFKSAFAKLGGPELTKELLDLIIENGEAEVELFSKRTNKPYTGIAVIDNDWGVKIDFNRPKKG